MSEIEKLYENAGIEKEFIPCPANYYGYDCTRNNWDDEDCPCDIEGYPPFTAEKQLELIKLLIKDYYYYLDAIDVNNFENSLAKLINDLWQSLTEQEKEQIKY